jgi:hypothetical protein
VDKLTAEPHNTPFGISNQPCQFLGCGCELELGRARIPLPNVPCPTQYPWKHVVRLNVVRGRRSAAIRTDLERPEEGVDAPK